MNTISKIVIALSLAGVAMTASARTITEQLTLSQGQGVAIKFPVGEVDMEIVDGDTLSLEIDIKPKNSKWFGRDDSDLSEVSLEKNNGGRTLTLEIDNDEISQHWHVKIPRSAAVKVDLGVGDVDISGLANSADLNIGVGSIDVETALNDFQRIKLDSGVGDTKIGNMAGRSDEQRHMVSSESRYRGQGEYEIEANVGVGDVRVKHR